MAYTILVVDDEYALRDVLAFALMSEGYEVWTAANGHEALGLCSWRRPDLILSDVTMPVLDGYGLVDELRARRDQTPVILVSAVGQAHCLPPCVHALEKPFDLAGLLTVVDDALRAI